MSKEKENSLQEEITILQSQLTGNMFVDMAIREEIHKLKMQQENIKPRNTEVVCVGCGS